jgi:type IV pilus assembly protein PilY1
MVYFGTGKYFETGDNIVGASPQVQTFYGLWDRGTAITDRANLQAQTIDFEGAPVNTSGTAGTGLIRVSSRNTVCYSAATASVGDDTPVITCSSSNLKKGWAMDLLKPVNIAQGERVVSPPVLYRDLVIFSTLIPSADPCKAGGESRVMLVEALTGKRPAASAFDLFSGTSTTPDGKVGSDDLVDVNGKLVAASGLSLDIGIHKNISVIGNHGYASGSSGKLGDIIFPSDPSCVGVGCAPGGVTSPGIRRSWRQLK